MTKPAQKRPVRYDPSGCMWGLISILDFRHGSRTTRKLLADKRRGSRQTVDAGELVNKLKESIDAAEDPQADEVSFKMTAADVHTNKLSVKALIEEEMVSEQDTANKSSDPRLCPDQHEDRKKNRKRNRRNSRGSLDMDVGNLNKGRETYNTSKCPCNHTPEEGSENKQNGSDIVLEEFCDHINKSGISQVCLEPKPKNSDLDVQEQLHVAIKEFISREIANEKNLMENGRVNFSKEVVDALQIPNLDEESFLKLLQDPSSFSGKNTDIMKSGKEDNLKDSEKLAADNFTDNNRKECNFFRRYMKSQEMKPPKKGHKRSESDTIVILKPGSNTLKSYQTEGGLDPLSDSSRSQQAESARAYFSLAEIKRRWKNVMGKEQNPDAVVKQPSFRNKGENPGKNSPSKDHFYIEKIVKPKDSKASTGLDAVSSPKQRVPSIYIEAKKHLSEMLSSGHEEVDSSPGGKSPKTLARILALSEFNSPIPSPGRNWEQTFVTAQTRFSGHHNDRLDKTSENAEHKMEQNDGSCLHSSRQSAETETVNTVTRDVEIEEDALPSSREDIASDACRTSVIESDEITREECSDVDTTSESISLHIVECVETIHSPTTSNQDGETQNPDEDVVHDNGIPSSSSESPPSSSITKTMDGSEISGDKAKRPSPVSVLEPLFMEEDASPARTASRSVELPVELLEINFEDEDKFNPAEQGNLFKNGMEAEEVEETLLLYVTSVLRACGLNWSELYLKSQSSDQLLEPSLYGEDDIFCSHPQYDQNLVFDCINDVLLEICDQHFRLCPRLSFTKQPAIRPIPDLKDAIHEVWGRVRWHLLLPMPLPCTLDQIVRKDMAKSEDWMDLRPDTESIGFETSDKILDDMIEDYVDESLRSLYASSFTEVKEDSADICSEA